MVKLTSRHVVARELVGNKVHAETLVFDVAIPISAGPDVEADRRALAAADEGRGGWVEAVILLPLRLLRGLRLVLGEGIASQEKPGDGREDEGSCEHIGLHLVHEDQVYSQGERVNVVSAAPSAFSAKKRSSGGFHSYSAFTRSFPIARKARALWLQRPGALADKTCCLNAPLIADWHTIATRREQLAHENL